MDFVLVTLAEMKFQTGMRYSCEHNLPETKRIRLVGCCETQWWYGFHISHFDKNDISFRVIKYHINITQNEMPTHAHQNIGLF